MIPSFTMLVTLIGRGSPLIHNMISFSSGVSSLTPEANGVPLLDSLSAILDSAFENAVAASVVCGILADIAANWVEIVGLPSIASSVVDSFIFNLRLRFGPISVSIIFIASNINIAFVYCGFC